VPDIVVDPRWHRDAFRWGPGIEGSVSGKVLDTTFKVFGSKYKKDAAQKKWANHPVAN